jgi:membrane associated rhomboid family serine protease
VIPLRDNIPARTTPWVNYAMIAACTVVFLFQSSDREGTLTLEFGMVPVRVAHPDQEIIVQSNAGRDPYTGMPLIIEERLPPSRYAPWTTLLTCIFLHGNFLHLLGNMWFLYIFGDNVEDRLGHWGFLAFLMGCGGLASGVHFLSDVNSLIPTIGASGAVAGVMGAYLLLYPHARVMTLIPIFFFLHMVVLPAPIFLGIWFLLQLLQGTFSIGSMQAGGVAWWAHIGGFAAGYLTVKLLAITGNTRPKVVVVRPGTERPGTYRVPRPWD